MRQQRLKKWFLMLLGGLITVLLGWIISQFTPYDNPDSALLVLSLAADLMFFGALISVIALAAVIVNGINLYWHPKTNSHEELPVAPQ